MFQWTYFIIIGLLMLLSIFASKISDRFGIPALLLFLIIGMLAGSEGFGGLYFDNPNIAQIISITALVLILFSGGLQTRWHQVRPVLFESLTLATIGVFLTALVIGVFTSYLLGLSLLEGLLLGSMMSSTDAAAVFSVLRSKGVSLKGHLKPLLELESGSNDPMAVFLTIGMIELILYPSRSPLQLSVLFLKQMLIGGVLGVVMGYLGAKIINRIRLGHEGLYPVLSLAFVLLTYGVSVVLDGSGFLAVYVAGLVLNLVDIVHKRTIQRFHDGLAWLMQITIFLVLGLFVFPSRLVTVMIPALLIALMLIFVARPIGVFLSLLFRKIGFREKVLISWVGLRGAAPIILATFPLLAGIPQADMFFNVVFFIVLTSVLLQGTTIPLLAKRLNLDAPAQTMSAYPIEYQKVSGLDGKLYKVLVKADSMVVNKAIVTLGLPENLLVVLVERDRKFIIPYGGTILRVDDILLLLTNEETLSIFIKEFNLVII